MVMVGIAPVADALGRVNKLEVVPMEELGRPRIDVVVNCSGVFRDLFVNQVRGWRLVRADRAAAFLWLPGHVSRLQLPRWLQPACGRQQQLPARDASTGRPRWGVTQRQTAFPSEVLQLERACRQGQQRCRDSAQQLAGLASTVVKTHCAVQMNLLDRAIKLAAEQDEPEELNFVRKHAIEQVRPAAVPFNRLPFSCWQHCTARLEAGALCSSCMAGQGVASPCSHWSAPIGARDARPVQQGLLNFPSLAACPAAEAAAPGNPSALAARAPLCCKPTIKH